MTLLFMICAGKREREMGRVQVHVGYTFTHYCIALGRSIQLDTHVANGKW